ncbi:hypothetical protein FZC76_17855 [Sutcliffiella horikoshii]|uniref:Uncharacterized protein n=1 Tax=Sutcliffiella horikoshii TaxID=79883 RepID=A0A5D4SRX3_9BACI|nr:hypothetical protein [Sutcliffiella horikoshii]TYS65749.1 hypothetical protein FZC76_17855 [Sutcliffiella horikoshii]
MESFKNDDKIILQQKIIHLGAEVKRLTAYVERLNSKSLLKNIEKQKSEYEENILQLKEKLAKLEEEEIEKVTKLQKEIVQYKGELVKQKEDHQGKLMTISNEVSQLKQQCEVERTAHLKAIEEKESLTEELDDLKRKLEKQTTINMDLEKEYEMVKETVKSLLVKIESSNQAHEGYEKIADINDQLEAENQSYRKMVEELEEEVKTLHDENSLLTDDLKKLNECVKELEKKGDQVIHESTKVSSLEKKKPAQQTPGNDPRIQSWFYNNVKKNT